jgi:hypothetical protein
MGEGIVTEGIDLSAGVTTEVVRTGVIIIETDLEGGTIEIVLEGGMHIGTIGRGIVHVTPGGVHTVSFRETGWTRIAENAGSRAENAGTIRLGLRRQHQHRSLRWMLRQQRKRKSTGSVWRSR